MQMRRKLIQLTNIHLGPYARLEHSCDLPILLSLPLLLPFPFSPLPPPPHLSLTLSVSQNVPSRRDTKLGIRAPRRNYPCGVFDTFCSMRSHIKTCLIFFPHCFSHLTVITSSFLPNSTKGSSFVLV